MADETFPFDTPDAFMAWLKTQSARIQIEACKTIELLMDAGLDGQHAAKVVYNVVNVARSIDLPFLAKGNDTVN